MHYCHISVTYNLQMNIYRVSILIIEPSTGMVITGLIKLREIVTPTLGVVDCGLSLTSSFPTSYNIG